MFLLDKLKSLHGSIVIWFHPLKFSMFSKRSLVPSYVLIFNILNLKDTGVIINSNVNEDSTETFKFGGHQLDRGLSTHYFKYCSLDGHQLLRLHGKHFLFRQSHFVCGFWDAHIDYDGHKLLELVLIGLGWMDKNMVSRNLWLDDFVLFGQYLAGLGAWFLSRQVILWVKLCLGVVNSSTLKALENAT